MSLSSLDQLVLSGGNVIRFATPCREHTGLQRSAVAECQRLWFFARVLIDCIQIDRGIVLRLATGEKADAWHSNGYCSLQSGNRCTSDVFRCVLLLALEA